LGLLPSNDQPWFYAPNPSVKEWFNMYIVFLPYLTRENNWIERYFHILDYWMPSTQSVHCVIGICAADPELPVMEHFMQYHFSHVQLEHMPVEPHYLRNALSFMPDLDTDSETEADPDAMAAEPPDSKPISSMLVIPPSSHPSSF
jgi:hypothetical protein